MTRELWVLPVVGLTLLGLSTGNAPSLEAFEAVARAAASPASAAVLPAAPLPRAPAPPPPAPPPPCGAQPGDLCPMQAWMKANAAAPLAARDFESLAQAFGRLAAAAPPGFVNWASIARDGADAARVEDVEAIQGACRGCHAQYAARYHASGGQPR